MTEEFRRITSIEELKDVAADRGVDCFILLNGGLRSSKNIIWHRKFQRWCVYNEIDGTQQELTTEQLLDQRRTNVGEAMRRGALYLYPWSCPAKARRSRCRNRAKTTHRRPGSATMGAGA